MDNGEPEEQRPVELDEPDLEDVADFFSPVAEDLHWIRPEESVLEELVAEEDDDLLPQLPDDALG